MFIFLLLTILPWYDIRDLFTCVIKIVGSLDSSSAFGNSLAGFQIS